MALNTIKWLSIFQEQLFPNNTFYSGAMNDSAYVTNQQVVIPNYQEEVTIFDMKTNAVISGPIAGPVTLPAGPNTLAHTDKTYTIEQFAFVPYYVDPVEFEEFAYDKPLAVMKQATDALNTIAATKILWDWTITSTNSVINSTATATRLNRFGNTVRRISFADIQKMATMLNLQNVPQDGRRLIVDAYGLEDIQVMPELQGSPALVQNAFSNGAVMRVAGFDVFMRSETTGFTGAGAKKAIGAADAATDLSSAIAYHPAMVRYAHGTKQNMGTKIFLDIDNPGIYGTEFSGYTRVAGSTSYTEANNITKGVITLVEAV